MSNQSSLSSDTGQVKAWGSRRIEIYDTTLRDGSQQEGISLTVGDKLKVAEQLDNLGVHFIEGGWPGANPKDEEFFKRAPVELKLNNAQLVAFGSTRRPNSLAVQDSTLLNLVNSGAQTVCIVAKAWDYHVTQALRTTLDEAIKMVYDSVEFLTKAGLEVFLDAEHFFDGYKANPEFALQVLKAAQDGGASTLVLCDTNGGALPHEVNKVIPKVWSEISANLGVHFHNDGGCAVANSLGAALAGATQIQGCINGYGERTGNADLVSIIANLSLKMGFSTIEKEKLEKLSSISHYIAEILNLSPNAQQPFVGSSAFAHKAGLHVSAISKRPDAYEHIDPKLVGNSARYVVSEMAGRSTLVLKSQELGLDLDENQILQLLGLLKNLENAGYHFEAADASLELLMRSLTGWKQDFFELESFRVMTERRGHTLPLEIDSSSFEIMTEATVKVNVAGERILATAEGAGPVHALDAAIRKAVESHFSSLKEIHLIDYRVRVLESAKGTGAVTRVLIDSTNGEKIWSTIGVSDNVIEASWQALSDAIIYGLTLAKTNKAML